MKKSRLATAAVAAVVVGTIGFSVPAFAASGYGAVNVTQNDSVVTIGNGALSRTFNISGKKLKPGKIDNELEGDASFTPGKDSEEFLLGLMTSINRTEPAVGALTSVKPAPAKPGASISLSGSAYDDTANEGGKGDGAKYEYAIDGDPSTYWASKAQTAGQAHLIIDFGIEKSIKSVAYTARAASAGNYQATGTIKKGSVKPP